MDLKNTAKKRCFDKITATNPIYKQLNTISDVLAAIVQPGDYPIFDTMRAEINALRDMCTQYEIAIDNGETPEMNYE